MTKPVVGRGIASKVVTNRHETHHVVMDVQVGQDQGFSKCRSNGVFRGIIFGFVENQGCANRLHGVGVLFSRTDLSAAQEADGTFEEVISSESEGTLEEANAKDHRVNVRSGHPPR